MNKNISILLLAAVSASAQIGITGNAAFVGAAGFSAASGGGCSYTTLAQSKTGATTAYERLGRSELYLSSMFTASQTYTGTIKVQVGLRKVGSPTGVLTAYIYADSGSDTPNDSTGRITADATIDGATVGSSEDYTTCSFIFTIPTSLESGTKYHLVIKAPSNSGDVGTCWNWMTTATGKMSSGDTGTSWGSVTTTDGGDFKIFTCN